MKVAFWGWNGKRNVGDDAMTQAMVEGVAKEHPIEELLFLGCNINDSSMHYLNEYKSKFKIKGLDFFRFKKYPIFHYIYTLIIFPLFLILKYDLIIIGGGSIFHSSKNNILILNLIYLKKILLKRKMKIVTISTSVGPFYTESAEKKFHKILKNIDLVSVRDKRSYEYCKSRSHLQLNYSPDVAIALPIFKNIFTSKKKKVNIILRQGLMSPMIIETVKQAIIHLHDQYKEYRIVMLSACSYSIDNENDDICIAEFLKTLPDKYKTDIVSHTYNCLPVQFYKEIGEASLNIAVRLHGSIISAAMNTPFITLSYHPKCSDFFHDLNLEKSSLFEGDKRDPKEITTVIDEKIQAQYIYIFHQNAFNSLGHFDVLKNVIANKKNDNLR